MRPPSSQDMLAYASSVGWKYKLHLKIPIDTAFMPSDVPDAVRFGQEPACSTANSRGCTGRKRPGYQGHAFPHSHHQLSQVVHVRHRRRQRQGARPRLRYALIDGGCSTRGWRIWTTAWSKCPRRFTRCSPPRARRGRVQRMRVLSGFTAWAAAVAGHNARAASADEHGHRDVQSLQNALLALSSCVRCRWRWRCACPPPAAGVTRHVFVRASGKKMCRFCGGSVCPTCSQCAHAGLCGWLEG
jgi:hypothetical protein